MRRPGDLVRRMLFIADCGFLIVSVASVLAARILIARAARNKTYVSVDLLPYRHVGLVLGGSKRIPGG